MHCNIIIMSRHTYHCTGYFNSPTVLQFLSFSCTSTRYTNLAAYRSLLEQDLIPRHTIKQIQMYCSEKAIFQLRSVKSDVSSAFTCLHRSVAAADSVDNERREDEYFRKMYEEWKDVKAFKDSDSTYRVIPKFYFKVPLAACAP